MTFVLHLPEVVGEQHRVEREPRERTAVHGRDREPMPGDADEANEPLLASFDRCLERTALAQRELPLDDVHEVVQLEQVDPVDAQSLERSVDLLLRALVVASIRLGGKRRMPSGCA